MTCAAISEAGRPGSSLLMMRAVAMPGHTGRLVFWAAHHCIRTGKLCLAGLQRQ